MRSSVDIRRMIFGVVVVCLFNPVVYAAPPVLGVSPTYLKFLAYEGGANPEPNILSIWRDGGNGPLNWTVTEGCSWLIVEPNSGESMGEVDDCNVIVDISGLTEGTYNCQLTVSDPNASNSPQIVDVNLFIYDPNLIGWWKFDEGTGTIAYDSAGNNDGNIIGDPNWVTGKIGSCALDFDGDGDYVRTANNIFTNAQLASGATLSAWFKTGSTAYGYIADDEGYLALAINHSTHPNKLLGTADGGEHIYYSSSEVNDNLWHYAAIVWNGAGTAFLYLDGFEESSGPSSSPKPDLQNRPFVVGVHSSISAYFDGIIDDFRVYDKALSAVEVWRFWSSDPVPPFIKLSATQFEFTASEGGANPNDQILGISNGGEVTLNWQITEDCDWLSAEPNSGNSTGEVDDVNLSVDISGLALGIYTCELTISDPNALNNPQIVDVNLVIPPWAGGGTAEDPYQIWDACDMQAIGADSNYWDAHFILCADINLGEYTGKSFNIIGTSVTEPFTGVFDGNGHTISNFTYSWIGHFKGIFGYIRDPNAEIKDLGLIDPNVDIGPGYQKIGSLAGSFKYGSITNCYVEGGSIEGSSYVGGLVGINVSGTITNCYSTANINGGSTTGGLVGENSSGTISNSYSSGSVAGTDSVGGLVGENYAASIVNCYAMANVTGNSFIGGLSGTNSGTEGGIFKCYSTGHVSGNDHVGGFLGAMTNTVEDCFWDVETSGTTNDGSWSGVTGKTTAEMQTMSTFTDVGWDFIAPIWTICECVDYPRLWWENTPCVKYGGGTGEANNPYLIYTAEQLNMVGLIECDWDKHFKLMADINLSAYTGTSFNIIGNASKPFTGVFDGNGHTISNFTYESTGLNFIGLFGYVSTVDAEIKGLGLIDSNVDAGTGYYVGGLVGRIRDGAITNCYVKGGSVSGNWRVAGLAGYNWAGNILNCSAALIVSGSDHGIGGLVGANSGNGMIANCCSVGSVSGYEGVGGLVGENYGTVQKCYAKGAVVYGDYYTGGLVGHNYGTIYESFAICDVSGGGGIGGFVGLNGDIMGVSTGSIENCYAMGNIVGTIGNVGGLVGANVEYSYIIKSYSTGSVSGSANVGGLVGDNIRSTVSNSFWDVNSSGEPNSAGGIGKTTAEMQTESTFTDAGWDFVGEVINGPNDIWDICEGTNYPKFVWQIPVGDFVCPDGVNFVDYAFFAEHWLQKIYGDCDGVELTGDGKVNWIDFDVFAEYWGQSGCGWCGGADYTGEGDVDLEDLDVFSEHWLQIEYAEVDLTKDGQVGLDDLGEFTENWLAGIR